MRVMLTSCGLETVNIKERFLTVLDKPPSETRALFIPTAAIDADAIAILPKCMDDLLKCGIPKENIRVFDLHRNMPLKELTAFDIVYLCGGRTDYLLSRINDTDFRDTLMNYIWGGGLILGVSAGSLIFANNLPKNLGLLDTKLEVHGEQSSFVGAVPFPLPPCITLSNTAALLIRGIPGDLEMIDEIL